MIELLFVLLGVAAVTAWWQLMQGRQKALLAAKQVCANHGLQLLDDTVSLSSVTWNRTGKSSHFMAIYSFEFAINGSERRAGEAQLAYPATMTITLDLEQGRLIEEL